MPSANQFTTSTSGAGFDPADDQRKRMLASGVNQNQGQPNLDPGKMGNPYGSGNPYGGAPVPFVGNSTNAQPGCLV